MARFFIAWMSLLPLVVAAATIEITPYQPDAEEIDEFMYRMIRDGLGKPIDSLGDQALFVCRYERRPGGYSTDLSCGTNRSWNYVRDLMLMGLGSSYGGNAAIGDRADNADFIFTMRTVSRRRIQEKIDTYTAGETDVENRDHLLRMTLLFLVGLDPGSITWGGDNDDLIAFALAHHAVTRLQFEYDPEIANAHADHRQRLIAELDTRLLALLDQRGMPVDVYNRQVELLAVDAVFRDRVERAQALLEQLEIGSN